MERERLKNATAFAAAAGKYHASVFFAKQVAWKSKYYLCGKILTAPDKGSKKAKASKFLSLEPYLNKLLK